MSKTVRVEEEEEEEEECFYESQDRLLSLSSSCSCSASNSDDDDDDEQQQQPPQQPPQPQPQPQQQQHSTNNNYYNYNFALNNYDIWISQPSSVSERRTRLLQNMGLSDDPSLTRGKLDIINADFSRSVSSDHLNQHPPKTSASAAAAAAAVSMVRSKSDGACENYNKSNNNSNNNNDSSSSILSILSVNNRNGEGGSPGKPPSGKSCKGSESSPSSAVVVVEEEVERVKETEKEQVCTIRDLDNGKEFVVKEIREDGMWDKVREVGTGRQLTMEEFEMTVGHSPIVQELMRRQNVEEGNGNANGNGNAKDNVDNIFNANGGSGSGGGGGGGSGGGGGGGGGFKVKKKGGWLKSIKSVASSMAGHKERRSSDERDTSSEKGGRRSSSATDDSQDAAAASFHGPERVRVRQYGKSCKELTAMYKSQEIQAHNGSIWSIKFSLDGKYLASAGEDCVIHVWQVVESERKGELLMERPEDGNVNMLFVVNASPEPAALLSPTMDSNHPEKRRKGRSSISRKSLSLDQFVVPETVFALTEKPICSFQGHLHDVLDLSWSKSQVSFYF